MTESRAAEPARFRSEFSEQLDDFLGSQERLLADIAPEAVELVDAIRALASGGKRMRASLCYWGWRGAGGDADTLPLIVRAGVALELFQSAALIHDDIIDGSDRRRGAPSVHRRFEQEHRRQRWALDPERFGEAAAILVGDLCLSFSEQVFASIRPPAFTVGSREAALAREIFDTMRREVMAGQYLDIFEEVAGASREREAAADRARIIIRYKSAKYSVERPLGLGGALGGGSTGLLDGYSRFGLPLGEAFQLRDDLLGVFGDPEQTGKPAGDDLREGKRTVLIGYALQSASAAEADRLQESLGDPELNAAQIDQLREIITSTGAVAATERLIAECADQALSALSSLDIDEISRQALSGIARAAVQRTS
ncbi:polyprenyl synthetase family protein [Acaricomes phytoseiuli]|uniref:polyprenyl synthetase family protein n=1 Tax=Acaricomes phytoseiuli TaxID=291968 RepID=UPI00037571C8|nr:polyprenyl synthetase family protein [Acaricomes phytoseiuli]MCW1249538.1 polyprenyl synthetase family protein [Acaricomes phytoseiuli]